MKRRDFILTGIGVLIGLLFSVYHIYKNPKTVYVNKPIPIIKDSIIIKDKIITKTIVKPSKIVYKDSFYIVNINDTIVKNVIKTEIIEPPVNTYCDTIKKNDYELQYNITASSLEAFKYNIILNPSINTSNQKTTLKKDLKPLNLDASFKLGYKIIGGEITYNNYGIGLDYVNKNYYPYLSIRYNFKR